MGTGRWIQLQLHGAINTDSFLQPRNDVYGAYDASYLETSGPKAHTQSPLVTGTSVVAVKFKDGVVIAADNLGPYINAVFLKLYISY